MKIVRRVSDDIPEDTIGALTGESLFASRSFAVPWQTRGGRRVVWTVEDGGAVVAALPGIEFGRGPLRRLLAMPDGLYGRLFKDPSLTTPSANLSASLGAALADEGYAKVYIYDFFGTLCEPPPFHCQEYVTTVVDIPSAQWEPPDRKLRAEIRKAKREGVDIDPFDWTRHRRDFLRLVEITERSHGRKPRYGRAFWKALAAAARQDRRIRWIWCSHAGRPIASHIYFVEGPMLQGWQMYYDRSFPELKANQYAIWTMATRAAGAGATLLNLGATPDEATGMEFFKKRWGGRAVTYKSYTLRQGIGKYV